MWWFSILEMFIQGHILDVVLEKQKMFFLDVHCIITMSIKNCHSIVNELVKMANNWLA